MLSKRRDLAKLNEYYRMTFETPAGEEVLKHLVQKAKIMDPIPIGDPIQSAFFEGQRHLMLSVLKFLNKDLSYLQKLMEEEQNVG